jgi:TRAP-type C4-dicarboxylate transport system permease small subunit
MADALYSDSQARPDALVGKVLNSICRLFAVGAGIMLILMAAMSLASIVGRSFFGKPIVGDYELVQIMSAMAVSLALPFCQMIRGHVIVDFFTAALPAKTNKYLDILASMVLAIASFLLTWRIGTGLFELMGNDDASMLLNIPTWWGYVPMVPSFFLLGCAALYTAWVDISGARA